MMKMFYLMLYLFHVATTLEMIKKMCHSGIKRFLIVIIIVAAVG